MLGSYRCLLALSIPEGMTELNRGQPGGQTGDAEHSRGCEAGGAQGCRGHPSHRVPPPGGDSALCPP